MNRLTSCKSVNRPAENLSSEPFLVHPFWQCFRYSFKLSIASSSAVVNLLVHMIFVVYASRHDLSKNQWHLLVAVILQAFTDTLIFPFFEYFWVSATARPVDRMKQLTSDLRQASRMTSLQDVPILALGYSSLVAPIKPPSPRVEQGWSVLQCIWLTIIQETKNHVFSSKYLPL